MTSRSADHVNVAAADRPPAAETIFDELFHRCAWAAYLEEAAERRDWPDAEATRRRAFDTYERELARKNGRGDRGQGAIDSAANGQPAAVSSSSSLRATTASMRSTMHSPSACAASAGAAPTSRT